MTALTDKQLMALMQAGKALEGVAPSLPPDIQIGLFKLEQRAGNTYASGNWKTAGGESFTVPLAQTPPTTEEAQQVLGGAYLALQDQQTTIKNVMNEMGLTPSAPKIWIDQIVGWFR